MNQGFKGICGSDLGKVGELAPIGGSLLSLSELGAHCVWVISQPLGFSNEPWTCRRRLLLESGDVSSRGSEVAFVLWCSALDEGAFPVSSPAGMLGAGFSVIASESGL